MSFTPQPLLAPEVGALLTLRSTEISLATAENRTPAFHPVARRYTKYPGFTHPESHRVRVNYCPVVISDSLEFYDFLQSQCATYL
jgi:hypothetical protein